MANQQQEQQEMWRLAAKYSALGIEITAAVAIGAWGGMWLDERLGTEPFLFWFGVVVGVGAAGLGIRRTLKEAQRDL